MSIDELVAWLNTEYPGRDWNQWCQQLMWNCVYKLMGYERDSQVVLYGRADLARDESHIESTDAAAAPAGAMHWFRYPHPDGHVGMSLGGSRVLMTGTKEALGDGGVMLGTNYGATTVEAYVRAKRNPYLGWSRTNGRNESLIGKIGAPAAQIQRSTRMHAVRQIGQPDSGVIIGGGQPPRARHESVFVAECAALGITPVDCPDWQYGTVVREAWTDFSTSAKIIADAVAGRIPSGGVAPIGVSESDAKRIATAVADEHATRMKS